MMEFHGRGILLDIEGTVCAVSFVYDVLFPFARRELPGFLAQAWEDPAQADLFDLLAQDAGCANRAAWLGGLPAKEAQQRVATVVYAWMDQDRKLRGLKELQGRVWRSGYESGTLRSRLFPDVAPALRAWVTRGFDVRIYSSGSAAAQQLFFR